MSSNFGITERYIAGVLSRFPGIKHFLKKAYQKANYAFYSKKYKHKSPHRIIPYTYNEHETFFGYYDHPPLNKQGNYIIFHASYYSTEQNPRADKPVEIVLQDFGNQKVIKTFPTFSYNWQQGARLQWLDDVRFIFNDYDKRSDRYISKIVDAEKQKIINTCDFPVYDCFNDYAVSLNFDRLQLLRPDYGYSNRQEKITLKQLSNKNDGIFKIDLANNTSRLIVPLEELINNKPVKNFAKSNHKVNHLMISPEGDKLTFIHRCIHKDRRYDRLYVCNMNGDNLKLITEGIVSHCCWYGNKTILGFFTGKNEKTGFHIADINTAKIHTTGGTVKHLGDGHPNIFNDLVVFDTYPDKSRMKKLFIYNLKNKELKTIGEFYEGFDYYDETRCDLHPRWGYKGKYIFFDSVHQGKRKLYSIVFQDE